MFELSRLLITGGIDVHTPFCVIKEIAEAHGIRCDGSLHRPDAAVVLIEAIHNKGALTISTMDPTAWGYLGRFVNGSVRWPRASLQQAYNFMIRFAEEEDPLQIIPENFQVGLQTPENIFSINTCVLYRTCIYHGLQVQSHTTINQMAYGVRMLRENVGSLIRRVQTFIDDSSNRNPTDFINILLMSPHSIHDPKPQLTHNINYHEIPPSRVQHQSLVQLHSSLTDVRFLQRNIIPKTIEGSIALAALNYHIDLTCAQYPIYEYKILSVSGRDNYVPEDPWMRYWFDQNSAVIDLLATFNPKIPYMYYDSSRLIDMAVYEGFPREEAVNEAYELMQMAYVSDTFYLGRMPQMIGSETPISFEPIQEIPVGELLCYGKLSEHLKPISLDEIDEMLTVRQNFTDPFNPESVMSAVALNKLRQILSSTKSPRHNEPMTEETINRRRAVVNKINRIDHITHTEDPGTLEFLSRYNRENNNVQKGAHSILVKLLHIGMYMRGWKGPGHEYPIVHAPVAADYQAQLAVNVTEAISDFYTSCKKYSSIGQLIRNLPLVRFRGGVYQKSNDHTDGLTIDDRLQIAQQGEQARSIASCIRITSNWLCSSAHKYLIAIGEEEPFDIFALRYIS